MIKQSPSELVDDWVKRNHMYLKDGGGAQGLHPKVREDLIMRLVAFQQDCFEVGQNYQSNLTKSRAPRKKTADASK